LKWCCTEQASHEARGSKGKKYYVYHKARSEGKCARGACSAFPGSIREESAFSEYALIGVALGETEAYPSRGNL
jgi:hypothetical protein